tara:strand:- start:819 stop:1346 length:528 start_codon:yes stop_codon:yes gene_type:complete
MASPLFYCMWLLNTESSEKDVLRIVSAHGDLTTLSQKELFDLIGHHSRMKHHKICSLLDTVQKKQFERKATQKAVSLVQDMKYGEIKTAFDDYIAKFISPGQPFKDDVFLGAQSFKIALVLKETQRVRQRTYARVIQSDAESSHLEPAEKALVEFFQHYHGLRKWTGTRLLSYVK